MDDESDLWTFQQNGVVFKLGRKPVCPVLVSFVSLDRYSVLQLSMSGTIYYSFLSALPFECCCLCCILHFSHLFCGLNISYLSALSCCVVVCCVVLCVGVQASYSSLEGLTVSDFQENNILVGLDVFLTKTARWKDVVQMNVLRHMLTHTLLFPSGTHTHILTTLLFFLVS